MTSITDSANSIVLDNGSGNIRLGYSSEAEPCCIFPNLCGVPKYQKVSHIAQDNGSFIGDRADKHKGLLKLLYPMERGNIIDPDKMHSIWAYMFSPNQLNRASNELPILITEPALPVSTTRIKITEFFFESLNVPALTFATAPVLSLYAQGLITGCVVDSGDTSTSIVPVYDGYLVAQASRRINLGGRDVTRYFQHLLFRDGYYFSKSNEFEMIKKMKEVVCQVNPFPTGLGRSTFNKYSYNMPYILPDGTQITVGSGRNLAAEIMFEPEIIGEECSGVAELLCHSVLCVDVELRSKLLGNVILVGGNTLLKGFDERLAFNLRNITEQRRPFKIWKPADRLNSAWKGGSLLCSLSSFKDMWVRKQAYDEEGPLRLFSV